MARYRHSLPQLENVMFLSDGGMETTLIFNHGIELPHFASFVLLETPEGRERLVDYYENYLAIARDNRVGFVLDTATWRANADWGSKLDYDAQRLKAINTAAVALLERLRDKWETSDTPCVISGAIGPRGDGYKAGRMTVREAEAYHKPQIESFEAAGADLVTAYTINNVDEAIGIARAAKDCSIPCAISFTVETDGRLATGATLRAAVERTDDETGSYPVYYMINCAHPAHFESVLKGGEAWLPRIRGVKANASTKSHAELDESETLDAGDPVDLGRRYRDLRRSFPAMRILGGCCGTDHRHVAAICDACLPPRVLNA
jgi:homocysteine S-methyltransferase